MKRGIQKAVFSDLTVTAVSYAVLVVTLTSVAHGLLAGEKVTVAGVNTAGTFANIDGTWTLTSVTADTMTFSVLVQPTGTTPQTGLNATHAVNSSSSGRVNLRDGISTVIEMPAAWTTADIEIDVSTDGITFVALQEKYAAAATSLLNARLHAPAVSTAIPLDRWAIDGAQWMRLRSTNAGLSTVLNQAAPRTLKVWTLDED